jgi:transcriptional antiterminator NusG
MSDEQLDGKQTRYLLDSEDGQGTAMAAESHSDDEPDALEEDEGVHSEEVHAESAEADVAEQADEPAVEHATEAAEPAAEAIGETLAESAGEPPVEIAGPEKHWYIIHAYSGFEQKVAESLRTRSQAFGFAARLGQILIPTEEVIELRNGKKVTSKRLLYPGYVLVEMEMDDELWHAVKSTPRVTGFVGGGTKPVPLTADEVNSVLYRQQTSKERPRPKMSFEKGEMVKITDGPFTNFSGKIDEVNSERDTLRVMVTIFGRSTPVELEFLQVEKI